MSDDAVPLHPSITETLLPPPGYDTLSVSQDDEPATSDQGRNKESIHWKRLGNTAGAGKHSRMLRATYGPFSWWPAGLPSCGFFPWTSVWADGTCCPQGLKDRVVSYKRFCWTSLYSNTHIHTHILLLLHIQTHISNFQHSF